MNIHSEYCSLAEAAVLPDEAIKVLGIHSEGFYFLIHHNSNILYALLGSFRNGISNKALHAVMDKKPEFRMSEVDRILMMPDAFVLTPNELLLDRSEQELFGMVNILLDSHKLMKSKIDDIGASLLSAFPSSSVQLLQLMQSKQPVSDLSAVWLNKIIASGNKAQVHALIFPSRFVIAIFINAQLQLFNSFKYADKNDFLYYFIGAVKSCNLKPEVTEIQLCGEITPSSPLAQALDSYFFQVLYDAAPCNGEAEARILSTMLYPLF